ncbi:MAG: sigma-70 family RNA polymerase sigma factor [Oscillibacter sp.]
MGAIHFNSRGGEWIGDMSAWMRENAEDNTVQMDRLRRNLRKAREEELTPRQRELLDLYYDQGMNMPQIAAHLGINRSTVSRTIWRAKQRLYQCLRYGL